MSKIDRLRQRLAGRWDFVGRDHNIPDDTPAKDIDKEYGPRGVNQEAEELSQEIKYLQHDDSGAGVRLSPLTDDFESTLYNTDTRGRRIQDTESVQGQIDKKGMITLENAKRWAKLRQRIAQVRLAADYSMESWKSFGPDMDAVKAFINKRTYKSGKGVVDRKTGTKQGNYKFRTDGRTLFVWDSPVVKHSKDGGYDVSGAKYNTPLTMSTINAVGIHAREGRYDPEGRNRISLGSEFLASNDPTWVHISPDEVQSKPVIYEDRVGGGKKRGTSGVSGVRRPNQAEFSSATIARERGEAGRERGNPPSKTNIQPTDQEDINKITGLNTKIPRETLGVKAHHYLDYADKGKDLPKEHGGIMLPDDYHDFITRFQKGSPKGNQRRLRQVSSKLRLKIARIRMAAAAPGIRMNPQHGRTIADAFDTMQHTPNSPKVKASYNAFINETNDQAKALQKSGVKFEALGTRQPYGKKGGIQGYEGYKDMHSDIEKNKHLFYRISDNDYKGFEDNPMFKMTNIRNSAGRRMRANDVFRAVHDINGHNLAGRSAFTPSGEHKAFLQHRKAYSPLASKAMFTETAGQGNWTNYSKKHGAKNQYFQKINKLGNLKFPQQKAGLLPDNIISGIWHQRLGKQRNIRVKTSIRTMQARVGMKLRHSDNMRNYDNLVKTPEGRQWIEDNKAGWYIGKDGTPRNVVNNPRDAQKSLEETPGKGDLYVVANTKDVRDPYSKEISDGFEKWEKDMPDADVSIGGYTDKLGKMEYDSSAAFRSDSPQKAMGFAKKYNQASYMVISDKNAEVNFYNPDGSAYT